MKFKVNGEEREFSEGLVATELLEELGIGLKGIAFEINRVIVPKGRLADTELKDGDIIEIVRMVGGG